jgi:hypothetical protein
MRNGGCSERYIGHDGRQYVSENFRMLDHAFGSRLLESFGRHQVVDVTASQGLRPGAIGSGLGESMSHSENDFANL